MAVKKRMRGGFRLSCKKLFLTYPQCGISLSSALDQLKLKLDRFCLESYLLVVEDHDDKSVNIGTHLHIYLRFAIKLNIKNPAFLDLMDDNHVIYHGNYQSCKNTLSTISYLLKDVLRSDEIILSSDLEPRVTSRGVVMTVSETMIHLAKRGLVREAMDIFEKDNPDGFLKSGSHYEKRLKEISLSSNGISKKFDLSKFNVPAHLYDKFDAAMNGSKTLVVVGSSGIGKSRFIESYLIERRNLRPLFINNFDSIREFDRSEHDCIVLDDCDLSSLSRETLIKLFDSEQEVTLNVRYGNIRIPESTPRLLVRNKMLNEVLTPDLACDPAIKRRVVEIHLENDLILKGVEEVYLPSTVDFLIFHACNLVKENCLLY